MKDRVVTIGLSGRRLPDARDHHNQQRRANMILSKRNTLAFGIVTVMILSGCSTTYRTYAPPNLPKAQIALIRSDLKMVEIDKQTKSVRGFEYAKTHKADVSRHFDVLPGKHSLMLEAVNGTAVREAHPPLVYYDKPRRFSLTADFEASKIYDIILRADPPYLTASESLKKLAPFDFGKISRQVSVVLVSQATVVATATPLEP